MTCALLLGQGGAVLPGDGPALLPGHGLALLAGRVAARLPGDGGALLPRHHPGHLLTPATWCRCRCWGGGGQVAVLEAGCQTQRWRQQTVPEAGAAVGGLMETGLMVAWLVVTVALPISVSI